VDTPLQAAGATPCVWQTAVGGRAGLLPDDQAADQRDHDRSIVHEVLDSQQRIIVGQPSLACMRSIASTSSLAFGGRVYLHVLLLGCSTSLKCASSVTGCAAAATSLILEDYYTRGSIKGPFYPTSVNAFMFEVFRHLMHLNIIYVYYALKMWSTQPC
jgi:hypothetical protein